MTLYYCNVNGFLTKKESILKIVSDVNPKVFALCETKLPSGGTLKAAFPDYEICFRPTKAGKSGIAIGVKKQTFSSILDVTSTPHNGILAIRITMAEKSVRIILGYAPQETDNRENREAFFTELGIEITNCLAENDLPIVIGDLNAKISQRPNDNVLEGVTSNGRLLIEVIENHELDVLNFHPKCTGKWTHVTRTTGASSVLDYLITCRDITRFVDTITINEDCVLCPFWLEKKRGAVEPHYSDHNPIIATFHIAHQAKKESQVRKWKITMEGLEAFSKLTTDGMDVKLQGENVQQMYNFTEDTINAAMGKCFRKAKNKGVNHLHSKYMAKYKEVTKFARKGRSQRKVAKMYIQELKKLNTEEVAAAQKEKINTTLRNLTIDDKFSPTNFWQLCKKSRNQTNSGTSVENEDGTELYGDEMIKNAYLKEFVHRLRKREIVPELKNYESRTELICKMRLEETKNNKEPPYTETEYKKVKDHLKNGKSCGRDLFPPDIFISGGDQLNSLILTLMNHIKSADLEIHQWTLVLISTIYKNKGRRKQLVNQRGIFLKQVLSKIFEKLNMNRIDDQVKRIDKFQAGSRTNRSPADQTFLLRAGVDHCKYLKKALFVVLYDYKQCFDSLWLSDCLLSLWNLGVTSETLNNLKNLNETCNMKIKTPLGTTDEATVKSIVQQGSVSGGVLCSASTGEVTKEDLGSGCQIGTTSIKALTFVDDIASTNTKTSDTYTSHNSIVWFSKKKRIPLNVPKCMGIGINMRPTDILPRLKIDEHVLKWVDVAVYLGDQFNASGTNKNMIEDRVKKGRACIVTATAMCSETTLGCYAIETLLLLYKSLFLPVVLFNSQAWSNISKVEMTSLKTVQLKFLKRIFHSPPSTSNPITLLETGTLPIEQEINVRQLNFLHHILTLDDTDPVKNVYLEQCKLINEKNWANEIFSLRSQYQLVETDAEVAALSKPFWKKMVKRKVKVYALEELNNQLSLQKHGSQIDQYEELRPQEYLSKLVPYKARKLFHIRAGVLDIKTVRKYWYNDTVCRLCQNSDETLHHIINDCPRVQRNSTITDMYTTNMQDMEQIADRCVQFASGIKEHEQRAGSV